MTFMLLATLTLFNGNIVHATHVETWSTLTQCVEYVEQHHLSLETELQSRTQRVYGEPAKFIHLNCGEEEEVRSYMP